MVIVKTLMVNFDTLLVDDTLLVIFLLHYWLADTSLVIDTLIIVTNA